MKKLLSFAIAFVTLTFLATLPSYAINPSKTNETTIVISENIETFEDGSQLITVVYEDVSAISTKATTFTKTGSKTASYKNSSGDVLFTLTTKGTFSVVSGTSSTCTSASYSHTAPGSGWSLKSGSASKSGNKAIGKGTFVKKTLGITVDTRDITCTLTCDVNGNLS